MTDKRDLLIEIGTEELPPKALNSLSIAFLDGIRIGLDQQGLTYKEIRRYATPRRLAVLVNSLSTVQPDQHIERRGPAIAAAFKNGKPTAAAMGFARSCGVSVDSLETQETDKGAWLIHRSVMPGNSAHSLLPGIISAVLKDLPVPKRMRWSDQDVEFVRPVHWVVMLLGDEVIPATILGVHSGRTTYGHRFHYPHQVVLTNPVDYPSILKDPGRVIVDIDERRKSISDQITKLAKQANGYAIAEDDLLDEVTALVEWPVAVLGDFDRRFLDVPAEALISTMRGNQKYFHLVDDSGNLLPYFITIANIESQDVRAIRTGNERVIRPRFSDAEFFWHQDRKRSLASRIESLKSVIFQNKLGTLHDKCNRISALARFLAEHTGCHPEWSERAGWLSKTDLLTEMVQEFPELQGTMARYYARHDGEPAEVALALEEQYKPRFSGDSLATTATGRNLAVADRLDSIIGIFAIGEIPSGAKDPFALRRSALGVIRTLIEGQLDVDLEECLEYSSAQFGPALKASMTVQPVLEFIFDRLRTYYIDQGFRTDEFEAVLECRPTRLLDFDRRLKAVARFRTRPEADSLTAANKRIHNLLKKVDGTIPFKVTPDLLCEEAEQILAGRLAELSSEVIPLIVNNYYEEALERLANLKEPVDQFFDKVLVMVEQKDLRKNRIALLNELSSLFLRIADFSKLQS